MDFELGKTTRRRTFIRGLAGTAMIALPLAAGARTALAKGPLGDSNDAEKGANGIVDLIGSARHSGCAP